MEHEQHSIGDRRDLDGEVNEYVTMMIGGQLVGIPVLQVQDVLGPQAITSIPLAPPEVAGSLNLRGRVVTAVDLRLRMGLNKSVADDKSMSVVVEHGGELFSLMVDTVGEVLKLQSSRLERNPATLDAAWCAVSDGVFQLKEGLLVVLNVDALLRFDDAAAA